jgi:hypothetical protein
MLVWVARAAAGHDEDQRLIIASCDQPIGATVSI